MKQSGRGIRVKMISVTAAAVLGVSALGACGSSGSGENAVSVEVEGKYKASDFEQLDISSDTTKWICAAYAIYTKYNDKSLSAIGGLEGDDREWYRDSIKEELSGGWGIKGRKDVERVVNKLLAKGHKEEYAKTIQELKKKKLLDLSTEEAMANLPDDEDLSRYQVAHEAYQKYGEHGIDGWDYCRALQILGDCYQADYIILEECLDMSLPIAEKLQSTYESWEGVAESYLYGFSFWKEELPDDYESQERWDTYEELKTMQASPYEVDYNTKLENTWKDGAEKKKAAAEQDKKEGYVPVKCGESGVVKVRLPEEYVWDSENESDIGTERFSIYNDMGFSDVDISYNLESLRENPNAAESAEEWALLQEESAKENVKEGDTQESSGIQTRQVGEFEVHYLIQKKTDAEYQQLRLKGEAWAEIDGKYLLKCEYRESVELGQETRGSMDGSMWDTLYGDIKW